MPTKTLADLRPGDYVAHYCRKSAEPTKRKVTSTGGGIMLEATGRNPEFYADTGLPKPYTPGATACITVVTPEITAHWKHQENLAEMRRRLELASPDQVAAMLEASPAQREHIVELSNDERTQLLAWAERPNGSCRFGRVNFEAVQNGGLLVRTLPYG